MKGISVTLLLSFLSCQSTTEEELHTCRPLRKPAVSFHLYSVVAVVRAGNESRVSGFFSGGKYLEK